MADINDINECIVLKALRSFSVQVNYELLYWLYIAGTVYQTNKSCMQRNCFLSSFYMEQFNNDADEH